MNIRAQAVSDLEARIGHVFADRELLERALTHASVGSGSTRVRHNERLEFLGDRVLNLIVAEHLSTLRPEAREGELSGLMNRLVNYHACATAARAAGLREALRLDGGATKQGARDNARVIGDACEALIAALYLDAGIEAARAFVMEFWAPLFADLDNPSPDAKTRLQEWAMGRGLPAPAYRMTASAGSAHAPRFTMEVFVQGFEPVSAEAGSKREAEKLAAARLLEARIDPPQ